MNRKPRAKTGTLESSAPNKPPVPTKVPAKKLGEKDEVKLTAKRKKLSHVPRSDAQLLATKSGIRTQIRKACNTYGITRASAGAIKLVHENNANFNTLQMLNIIDTAAKSASLNKRSTVTENDMKLAFHAFSHMCQG